ncbi:MAG: DUF21 domain-containing protein [Lachnospiraceae bacterium]
MSSCPDIFQQQRRLFQQSTESESVIRQKKGNKRAALVLQLSDNYDSLLSTILIGNNIVNIGCSSLGDNFICKASWRRDGRGNFHTGDHRCGIDFR